MSAFGFTPNSSYVQAFTASSSQSQVGVATNNAWMVRLAADADCFVKLGSNPTVTVTNGIFMPAGTVEYFHFAPGWRVAVIQKSAAGTLYITEVSR